MSPKAGIGTSRSILMTAFLNAALGVVYFLAAKLGLSLAFANASASPVWPPTGLAIAAIFLGGGRLWPGVFVGAFFANWTTQGTPLTSLFIATGNTLEALIAVYLIRRFCSGSNVFVQARAVFKFILLPVATATMISATIGVTTLAMAGFVPAQQYGIVWYTWWLGDAVGALLVSPTIILWTQNRALNVRGKDLAELLGAGFLLVAIALTVFAGVVPLQLSNIPVSFMTVPIVVWIAYRFGSREASTATTLLSAIAVWGTTQGQGQFVRPSVNESLLFLQMFVAAVSITGLVLAAVVTERRGMEDRLREARDHLEVRVRERTASLTQAVERLRRSDAQLAEAQAIAHLGSWEWDVQRDQITWSDEMYRMFGLRPDQFGATYEHFLHLVAREDRDRVDAVVQRAYRDRMPFEFEHKIVRPDGSVRWLHGRGLAHVDEAGATVRIAGTAQDITERRRAEEELEASLIQLARSEKLSALGTLVSGVAHEIRTPLTYIGTNHILIRKELEKLLASRPELDAWAAMLGRYLASGDEGIRRIDRIVSQLHQFARPQPDTRPAVLHDVVQNAVDLFRSTHHGQVIVETDFQPTTHLDVDRDQMVQVVINLLNNASEAMPKGGRVIVRTRPGTDGGEFEVQDFGPGIAPSVATRLFDPFFTTKADGTGLGLSISRRIVEAHEGTLRYVTAPGQGTTFTVHLPRSRLNRELRQRVAVSPRMASARPPAQ